MHCCPSVWTTGSTGVGTTRSGSTGVCGPARPSTPVKRVRLSLAAVYAILQLGSSCRVQLGLPSCFVVRRYRVCQYVGCVCLFRGSYQRVYIEERGHTSCVHISLFNNIQASVYGHSFPRTFVPTRFLPGPDIRAHIK